MKLDAIVVLAGGVNSDGSLPEISRQRVDTGIKLYKNNVSRHLIFSGHFTFLLDNPLNLSESQAMKAYAVSNKVPERDIIEEDKSKDTLGNAYFVKTEIGVPKNLKRFGVVTSDFHIERTRYLFNKVFGNDYIIEYFSVPTQKNEQRDVMEAKQIALSKQWLDQIPSGDHELIGRLIFTKHPGYAPNPEITIEQLKNSLL